MINPPDRAAATIVAPFAGAWIEISLRRVSSACSAVAPFAGAWIEIQEKYRYGPSRASLPSRERGLKW